MKVSDSTILITGANRGIGLALLEASLQRGAAKVYATYRAEGFTGMLKSFGERVVPIHLDLADPISVAQLPLHAPRLNVLINNAGIFTGTKVLGPSEVQLRDDLETNLFGTLAVTKALLPSLRKEERAAIANVSSIAALAAMPNFGGYSASKAALHSITQSMRGELRKDGISVHGVYPGPVETRLTENVEIETTPAPVVAEKILDGIDNGAEDIFPDKLASQLGPLFQSSPKELEKTFASF